MKINKILSMKNVDFSAMKDTAKFLFNQIIHIILFIIFGVISLISNPLTVTLLKFIEKSFFVSCIHFLDMYDNNSVAHFFENANGVIQKQLVLAVVVQSKRNRLKRLIRLNFIVFHYVQTIKTKN